MTAALMDCGTIAADQEFFQDHFPGFPVLPGVLMLEIFRRHAEKYFRQKTAAAVCRFVEIRNVRYSNFLKPGDAWESRLELVSEASGLSEWKGQLLSGGQAICSAKFKLQSTE